TQFTSGEFTKVLRDHEIEISMDGRGRCHDNIFVERLWWTVQTNGICESFHRTVLDEFYRIAFRKKIYDTIDELQTDLDAWLVEYNYRRPHQGRWCFGKTPMQIFLDAIPLAKEKIMAA